MDQRPFLSVSHGLALAWMQGNLPCRCLHKKTLYNINFRTVCKPEEAFYLIAAVYSRFRTPQRVESQLTGISSIPCGANWRALARNCAFNKTQLIFNYLSYEWKLVKKYKGLQVLVAAQLDRDDVFYLPCPLPPPLPPVTKATSEK